MTPLLAVKNVSKTFRVESGFFRRASGAVRALRNVSFEIVAGKSLGLVGESGSGKTTLGKIIARFFQKDEGGILWEGKPIGGFSRRQWAENVQMIFQDPSASLNPKLSVGTLLGEVVSLRALWGGEGRISSSEIQRRVAALLEDVGLSPGIMDDYPHQFSGGQKQRLAIARVLAMKPRLLVADEPVSALDLSIQAQILNLFMDLREKFKLTTIIVSHDLAVISHLADDIAVMKDGEIVETGGAEEILSRPQNSYTRRLLEAVPPWLK